MPRKPTARTTRTTTAARRAEDARAARTNDAARVPRHLAQTPLEQAVTEFEQALICAAEAFWRFTGSALGPEGKRHKLSGDDNIILQQLMSAQRPRGIIELSRFANRDDISNIQYSLRKLIKAGLIEKAPGSTNRETTYQVTDSGRALTSQFLDLRQEFLMQPSSQVRDFEGQLRNSARALSLLTSFYDHGTRVVTGR